MVPAAIDGAYTIWPRNQAFNWRALLPWRGTRARIAIGPPVQAADADYAAQTALLREAVVAMWDRVHAERVGRNRTGDVAHRRNGSAPGVHPDGHRPDAP